MNIKYFLKRLTVVVEMMTSVYGSFTRRIDVRSKLYETSARCSLIWKSNLVLLLRRAPDYANRISGIYNLKK